MKAHDGQYPGVWSAPQMPCPCNGTLHVNEENNSIRLVLNRQCEEVDWEYRKAIHEQALSYMEGELFTGMFLSIGDSLVTKRISPRSHGEFPALAKVRHARRPRRRSFLGKGVQALASEGRQKGWL